MKELSSHLCECGCGQFTNLITENVATRGLVKGQPRRFVPGHRIHERMRFCKRGHEKTPENTSKTRACKVCIKELNRIYHAANPARARELAILGGEKIKIEVLTHYGPKGILGCCWEGCSIVDIEMLTLDHVNNDGSTNKSKRGWRRTGKALYYWARKHGYPDEFQTLCWNHQWKKQITKKRAERL